MKPPFKLGDASRAGPSFRGARSAREVSNV